MPLLSVYRDHGVVPFGTIEGNFNKPALELSNYLVVRRGDLVLNKMKTWQGSLAISELDGIVSPAYVVAEVDEGIDRRFLHHVLRSERCIAEYAKISYGVRVDQWDMRFEDFRNITIALPPAERQRAIAAFLDRKTAEIDTLIARKERLLELLEEKRTALITQAVTKGVTPGTSLRETGEDWLGTVPAHWRLLRLKFACLGPLSYGASEAAESTDPTLPRFVRITDLGDDGTLREETFKSLPEDVAAPYLLREGDLLFARSGATVGKSFRYDPSWGRAAYAGYLVRARLDDRLALPRFLWLFAQSASYWGWVGRNQIQSTIQNVSAERYSGLLIPLPSVDEQRSIVRFVEEQLAQLATLAGRVREAIALLREYRIALITAAVTGEIDLHS
jgi:hypothetical protein